MPCERVKRKELALPLMKFERYAEIGLRGTAKRIISLQQYRGGPAIGWDADKACGLAMTVVPGGIASRESRVVK